MSTAVADWPTFLTKLRDQKEVAERTMAFCFDKPASFKFTPGQFIDITLLNPRDTDSEGNARGFSIATAPYEDFIMVATRLRDTAFKRVLRSVPLGTEVKIEGPFGNLRLHNDKSRAAVVLTGGIGITPFRSILLHAAKEKLPHARRRRFFRPPSGFRGPPDQSLLRPHQRKALPVASTPRAHVLFPDRS
jgi:ferredoxin-NADP reductase